MIVVPVVAGVGGFWLLLIALVRHENGWVGISNLRRAELRLIGGLTLMRLALADALRPAFQHATRAAKKWRDAMDALDG